MRRREGTYVSYSYGPPGKRVKVCQFYSYGSFQFDGYFIKFNPLTARIFTVFGQFIRGQSHEAPRCSPQCPGP